MDEQSSSAYRHELDAAYARMDHLERQLDEARRLVAATPEVRARWAALCADREAARVRLDQEKKQQASRVVAPLVLGLVGTMLVALAVSSLGRAGHPMNALVLGLALTLCSVLVGQWYAHRAVDPSRRDVAWLDQQAHALATVLRQADAQPDDAQRVRVVTKSTPHETVDAALADVSARARTRA